MTTTAIDNVTGAAQGGAASDAVHVVQPGDTLSAIARSHGVSLSALEAANPQVLHPDLIRPGQALRIPMSSGDGAEAQPAKHPSEGASSRDYQVRPSDTLTGIGRRFGVDWRTLAQLNGVSRPDRLQAGASLKLSAGASPSRPAAAAPAVSGAPGKASVAAARYAGDHVRSRSAGECYAYVKTALQQAGAVSGHLSGVAAKGAGPQLEANGFHNVLNDATHPIRSPYDAPVGAVLVYGAAPGATDKNARYGHIEIRTATGFASDYASPRARTGPASNGLAGRGRELIGVYVKPDAATAPPARTQTVAPAQGASGAWSDRNLALGANAGHAADITAAARRSGLAPQALAALIDAEAAHDRSGAWNTQSYNADSHAAGLTQFLPGTWVGEAQRAGGYVHQQAQAAGFLDASGQVAPEHRQQVLDMRYDARTAIFAAADYAQANVTALRDSGDLPAHLGPAEIAQAAYLAHHEGTAGARRLLNNDTSHVSERQFRTNVPARSQQRLLDTASGDMGQAYRTWLSGYTDSRIDPRRFMADTTGVSAPRVQQLER